MKLTGTNMPITFQPFSHMRGVLMVLLASTVRFPRYGQTPRVGLLSGSIYLHKVTAIIATGKRPVPFRTRKLSLSAPMVLHWLRCGRVGRRRTSFS